MRHAHGQALDSKLVCETRRIDLGSEFGWSAFRRRDHFASSRRATKLSACSSGVTPAEGGWMFTKPWVSMIAAFRVVSRLLEGWRWVHRT